MLNLLETRPKEIPPAGWPAAPEPGSAAKGRLTTLPPSGRPKEDETGRSEPRARAGLFGENPRIPTGSKSTVVPSGRRTPCVAGITAPVLLRLVWNPWPTSVVVLLMLLAP